MKIYHETLSSAVSELSKFIIRKNYQLPECFQDIQYFQPIAYGDTFRDSIELQNSKNNGVSFQIYRLDSGNYELNCYFWK